MINISFPFDSVHNWLVIKICFVYLFNFPDFTSEKNSFSEHNWNFFANWIRIQTKSQLRYMYLIKKFLSISENLLHLLKTVQKSKTNNFYELPWLHKVHKLSQQAPHVSPVPLHIV